MKKSKHFRKDVIIARIIAAVICIVFIVIISSLVSALTKSDSDSGKNTQDISSENSQYVPDTEPDTIVSENSESEITSESETTKESETTSESETPERYVKTTAQVNLRAEPNTNCAVVGLIDYGVEVLLLEELDGWYKVSYNGQEGYISADYSRIVE